MDRNGKKPKAKPADLHAERSDTKSESRDTLGKAAADARAQGGGSTKGSGGGRKAGS